ncbi:MAG: hypothetical protein IJS42_05640 [Synergistaceae bacterium]|nr:hypothetical protein [Synergistaceae bacterium]
MGEKIRDVYPVRIGDTKLMVELNENYALIPTGGGVKSREIHLQNDRFRFALSEDAFIEFSATILRAKSEIDFYRNNPEVLHSIPKHELPKLIRPSEETLHSADNLSGILEASHVNHRFIEAGQRYASFIVNQEDYNAYREVLTRNSCIKECHHPHGSFFGYRFLYQMKPFELLRVNDTYCEIFFQLPSMSMTPKTWMPLDRMIQSLVWSNEGTRTINPVCLYIYRLCWAVFKDKGFSERTIETLKDNADVLREKIFHECMSKVFFKFTDKMIFLLENESFDEIIPEYRKFSQY